MNISEETRDRIARAYEYIECPCEACPYREDHHCKVYDVDLEEDEQVLIPADACEESMAGRV